MGEIVNLMSVDAQKLLDLIAYLNVIWSGKFIGDDMKDIKNDFFKSIC